MLKEISTKKLVEELISRKAVKSYDVDPYDDFEIDITCEDGTMFSLPGGEGPVRIILVWD